MRSGPDRIPATGIDPWLDPWNEAEEVAASTASQPTPGRFYQIRYGAGGLLQTAGKAYGLGPGAERLKRARKINDHPLNHKFRVAPTGAFSRRYFPDGILSFRPLFTCGDDQRRARPGERRCFARIWIPPLISDPRIRILPISALSPGAAPSSALRQILAACRQPRTTSGVVGEDDRKPVKNRRAIPHRWIAQILSVYNPPDPSLGVAIGGGTGFLFADTRRLATAAHVLHDPHGELADLGYDPTPDFVLVLPAFGGVPRRILPLPSGALPFGAFLVPRRDAAGRARFRVAPEWIAAQSSLFDYGVVDLRGSRNLASGTPPDAWGTVSPVLAGVAARKRSNEETARRILEERGRARGLFLAGYPGDRPCVQLRVEHAPIIKLEHSLKGDHNVLLHRADTPGGFSGSPVWIERKVRAPGGSIRNQRLLIGITAAVRLLVPRGRGRRSGGAPVLTNAITVVTPRVLRRLEHPGQLTPL